MLKGYRNWPKEAPTCHAGDNLNMKICTTVTDYSLLNKTRIHGAMHTGEKEGLFLEVDCLQIEK